MAATLYTIKQGARLPVLLVQIQDESGEAVDLTDATSATLRLRLNATGVVIQKTMIFADRANGKVQYAWAAGETDNMAVYAAEIDVLWADGRIETYPSRGFFTVKITPGLS